MDACVIFSLKVTVDSATMNITVVSSDAPLLGINLGVELVGNRGCV